MEEKLYTVTEANRIARRVLERISIWIEGEISEISCNPNYSFVYFKLKDEKSLINCTFPPAKLEKLDFELRDGIKVLAFGTLSVYEPQGKYQFRISKIKPYGEGALLARIEEIKKKLQEDGLFADELKKPVPTFPERIGVVTSKSGEAWYDIRANLRFPFAKLILADVAVEGGSAPSQIIKAIKNLNRYKVDLIVVARGGGPLEALMAFNDEGVARTISGSKIPVISAVGHEKDFPISDYVADARVSTPTAVGKLFPDSSDLAAQIHNLRDQMLLKQKSEVEFLGEILFRLKNDRVFIDPTFTLVQKTQRLDLAYKTITQVRQRFLMLPEKLNALKATLLGNANLLLTRYKNRTSSASTHLLLSAKSLPVSFRKILESYEKQLEHLSPEEVLRRGYSITYFMGKVLRSSRLLKGGEDVDVKLAKGSFRGKVVTLDE